LYRFNQAIAGLLHDAAEDQGGADVGRDTGHVRLMGLKSFSPVQARAPVRSSPAIARASTALALDRYTLLCFLLALVRMTSPGTLPQPPSISPHQRLSRVTGGPSPAARRIALQSTAGPRQRESGRPRQAPGKDRSITTGDVCWLRLTARNTPSRYASRSTSSRSTAVRAS
jgi:hypothetical protein